MDSNAAIHKLATAMRMMRPVAHNSELSIIAKELPKIGHQCSLLQRLNEVGLTKPSSQSHLLRDCYPLG
jgi:hypothetical protein